MSLSIGGVQLYAVAVALLPCAAALLVMYKCKEICPVLNRTPPSMHD
jgi:hypothetical protein